MELNIKAELPQEIIDMLINMSKEIQQIKNSIEHKTKIMTVDEFASQSNLTRRSVYNMYKRNEIDMIKIGGRRLVVLNLGDQYGKN